MTKPCPRIAAAAGLLAAAALLLTPGAGKAQDLATEAVATGLEHPWWPGAAAALLGALDSAIRHGLPYQRPLWRGDEGQPVRRSLKFAYLGRIELAGGKFVREHRLLAQGGERIRAVRQGPDGLLYVLTDSPRGRLLRLLPR